jgi:uncharacterized protein with von Willebrand factor type A (vWA) domain
MTGKRMFDSPEQIKNLLRNTIYADRWDRRDYEAIRKNMEEFAKAHDKLMNVIDTGSNLLQDVYMSLVQPRVTPIPNEKIRPSYLINKMITKEAMSLKEWEMLRQYSLADDVAAAMAATTMEPELEEIVKRVKDLQKRAQEIEKKLQDLMEKMEEHLDLDEMIKDLDEVPPEMTEKVEDLADQITEMNEAIEQEVEEFNENLAAETTTAKDDLRKSMQKAYDKAESMETTSQAFGIEDAEWRSMPPERRLELAKKFNSERIKKIAEMFGALQRLMWAERQRTTYMVPEEIHNVTTGDDLAHIMAHELTRLGHPIHRLLFFKDFMEKNLSQYELRGIEKVGKGGIICCIDESGSMGGQKEMWAKAVGLCLLNLAKEQKRAFYGVHFGSAGRIQTFDFTDIRNVSLDDVLAFASPYQGGGTDFETPLNFSLGVLQKEFDEKGSLDGDIVFITDGQAAVGSDWLSNFKSEQERIGFNVWGVIIGGTRTAEPLSSICDGVVFDIKDLRGGSDISTILANLGKRKTSQIKG